jgi:hypothetical protein
VVKVGGGGGCGSTLTADEELISGAELCSSDGSYALDMQTNGNLVEYNSSGQALWASGTYGIGGRSTYLSVQTDSNVVLYDSSGAVWAVRDFSAQTYAQEINAVLRCRHNGCGSAAAPQPDGIGGGRHAGGHAGDADRPRAPGRRHRLATVPEGSAVQRRPSTRALTGSESWPRRST